MTTRKPYAYKVASNGFSMEFSGKIRSIPAVTESPDHIKTRIIRDLKKEGMAEGNDITLGMITLTNYGKV